MSEAPDRLLERLAALLDTENDTIRTRGQELREAYVAHLTDDTDDEGVAEDDGGESP